MEEVKIKYRTWQDVFDEFQKHVANIELWEDMPYSFSNWLADHYEVPNKKQTIK